MKFATGCTLLFIITILVLVSETVNGMFLNFAAFSFLSEVDDVAFALGQYGLVTASVRDWCAAARAAKQPVTKDFNLIRFCFVAVFSALVGFYIAVVIWQMDGRFVCNKIFVQFGDDVFPGYSGFSGD
jgi:hypothetical protein